MATDVQTNLINESAVTAGGTGTASAVGAVLIVGRVAVEVTPSAALTSGCLLTLEASIDGTNWVQTAVVRTGLTSGETYGYEFDVSGWEYVRLTYGATSSNIAIRADLSGVKNV